MNELKIFENKEFGKVRTVLENGEPMFCLADVCRVLEIANARDCKSRLNEKGLATINMNTVGITDGTAGNPNATFINESNLYKVIFHSRKPEAEKFSDWVTHEVLPSIRKTGSYTVVPTKPKEEVEAMLKMAQVESAKILRNVALEYSGKSENYKQILDAYAVKEITGTFALPLPSVTKKTLSATEIGNMLGVTSCKIGMIANQNKLKTSQNGEWVHDKSAHSNKEIETFRYYESAVNEFRKHI